MCQASQVNHQVNVFICCNNTFDSVSCALVFLFLRKCRLASQRLFDFSFIEALFFLILMIFLSGLKTLMTFSAFSVCKSVKTANLPYILHK